MLAITPVLLVALALGAAPPADADARREEARPDVVATPAPPCVDDPQAVRGAVRAVYAQLVEAYGDALPGPRGQTLMQREVDRIIVASVDAEGFAEATLRQAWSEAPPERRARWQLILARMLHQRYRPKLKDPTHQELKLLNVQMDCDQAKVSAQLRSRRSDEVTQLELRLRLRQGQPWRVWDATLDGTSLVLTWRKRFTALFEDGGVPALEGYLATLAERYPCREQGCPR